MAFGTVALVQQAAHDLGHQRGEDPVGALVEVEFLGQPGLDGLRDACDLGHQLVDERE